MELKTTSKENTTLEAGYCSKCGKLSPVAHLAENNGKFWWWCMDCRSEAAPQWPEKVILKLCDDGRVVVGTVFEASDITRTIYLPPEGVLTLDELAERGVPVWCEDMRSYYGRDMRKMQALYCSYPTKLDAQRAATEWVRQRERGGK